MNDRVGQQIGNYKLVQLLGSGGFADVYLGKHIFLDSSAAIKLLHTNLTSDGMEAFRSEARTLVHLIHPNIVRILEFGLEGNIPFLVMDYAPNGTMRQRCQHGRQLPLTQVVEYVRQVASALQYAHHEKVIHRDVKPENMLLGRQNEIVLSDFGIAVVAQSTHAQLTQEMTGTIAYMAPEQIQAHPRPASDQYSLAIVAYEWLSGAPPFSGTFTEIGVKHMVTPPPPLRKQVPRLASEVEQVILTALAKEPAQRFSSIQDFAIALARASNNTRAMFAPTMLATPLPITPLPATPPPAGQVTPILPLLSPTPDQQGYASEIPTQWANSPVLARPEAFSSPHTNPPTVLAPPPITTYGRQAGSALPSHTTGEKRSGMSRRTLLLSSLSAASVLVAAGVGWQIITHLPTSPKGAVGSQVAKTPTTPPTATPDPDLIGQDAFQRPDQAHWGAAANGQEWSGDAATSPDCSIEEKTGQIHRTASGQALYSAILGDEHPDVEILFTAMLNSFSSSHLGAMARYQNDNHYYKVILDASKFHFLKRIDPNNSPGVGTSLAVTPKVNTLYSIRFSISDTTLKAKFWLASDTEPADWMITGSDDDATFKNGKSGLRPQLTQNVKFQATSFKSVILNS